MLGIRAQAVLVMRRWMLSRVCRMVGSTVRVLFINRYYHPDHSATSQLLTDLAEHLATLDTDVTVITSRQLYEDAAARLPKLESIAGVRVCRVWSSRFGRKASIGRAFDYLSFLFSAAVMLWRSARRGDVLVAKTDPPFLGFVVSVAVRYRGARMVNWVQDLFPDVAFAAGIRVPAVLRPVMNRMRDAALKHATVNVAIGDLMAERISTYTRSARTKVIHNWVPFSYVRPVARHQNPLRTEWGLGDRFVVGYSGNMGRAHEFETILAAAEALRDDPTVLFLLIGGGAHRQFLEREIELRGLTNVLLKPYQPAERLAQSLSAPDVHIVTLRPEMEGCIVPSKFYGALAAGRPVVFIGHPDGEIGRLVTGHSCGFAVWPGDKAGLVAAIDQLRTSPGESSAFSENAVLAGGHFGRRRALEQWRTLLFTTEATSDAP